MKRTVIAACMALALATPAFAHMGDCDMCDLKGGMGRGDMMGDRMDDMMGACLKNAAKIGLSDEQTGKIKPIHREMQKKQAKYKADLKIAQIELREIMEVKDFDLDKATAAVKKIEDVKAAHHLEMLKSMKEVRSILSDDQFKKMKKMMPMMMEGKRPGKMMKKK